MINGFIARLQEGLRGKLPGRAAHLRMAPSMRPPGNTSFDGSRYKSSGVLILLFPEGGGISTAFIERTQGGPHGGQVSLPGGKREKNDADLVSTALREAAEEIGIKADQIIILGQLTPLYVPHSNYCIQPVLGYADHPPHFVLNPLEVEEVVTVSLDSLFNPENKKVMDYHRSGITITAPYYDAGGHKVWGATAMIISELEALVTSCAS